MAMAENLPLPLTYEDASAVKRMLDDCIERIRAGLTAIGYDPSIIDREIAFIFLQRAATLGIDLDAPRGPTNGVSKP